MLIVNSNSFYNVRSFVSKYFNDLHFFCLGFMIMRHPILTTTTGLPAIPTYSGPFIVVPDINDSGHGLKKLLCTLFKKLAASHEEE